MDYQTEITDILEKIQMGGFLVIRITDSRKAAGYVGLGATQEYRTK